MREPLLRTEKEKPNSWGENLGGTLDAVPILSKERMEPPGSSPDLTGPLGGFLFDDSRERPRNVGGVLVRFLGGGTSGPLVYRGGTYLSVLYPRLSLIISGGIWE